MLRSRLSIVSNSQTLEYNSTDYCTAPEQAPPAPPAAQPIPPPAPVRKTPGATDGNYFVNCQASDGTVSSGMAYYKNLTPGQNVGQSPDDYVDTAHGSFVDWETSSSG